MKCKKPLNLTSKEGSVYTVPCGRCRGCRINRVTEWTTRILHEARLKHENSFITLTYSPYFLNYAPGSPKGSVSKRDLQLFFKRLRKGSKNPNWKCKPLNFRYFACGEYGEEKGRPHYHVIMFGLNYEHRKEMEAAWNKGIVHIGNVTMQSARYTAGYIQKQLFGAQSKVYDEKGISREFVLTSRRPGIGATFVAAYLEKWIDSGFLVIQGVKRPIPRFYLSKAPQLAVVKMRQRNNIQGYKKLYERSDAESKSIYEILDSEVDAREQEDRTLERKQEIYKNSKF